MILLLACLSANVEHYSFFLYCINFAFLPGKCDSSSFRSDSGLTLRAHSLGNSYYLGPLWTLSLWPQVLPVLLFLKEYFWYSPSNCRRTKDDELVNETCLNATSISHLWKCVTPGPEHTLHIRSALPTHYLPGSQPTSPGAATTLCRAEQSWATCQMKNCLNHDTVPSAELELYKADVINELLKHNAFVIGGLPTVNMF